MGTGLELAVIAASGDWLKAVDQAEARCRRAADAALAAVAPLPVAAVEASVILSDNAEVRRLNRNYRGSDKATNVLAFPAMDIAELRLPAAVGDRPGHQPPLPQPPLGDIFIALETAAAEARDQGKALGDHLSHLVVHGMLHLLGYDHQSAADAEEMEGLEVRILTSLGITDPYAYAGER